MAKSQRGQVTRLSTTGASNVAYESVRGKYKVEVQTDNGRVYGGRFNTLEEAKNAVDVIKNKAR